LQSISRHSLTNSVLQAHNAWGKELRHTPKTMQRALQSRALIGFIFIINSGAMAFRTIAGAFWHCLRGGFRRLSQQICSSGEDALNGLVERVVAHRVDDACDFLCHHITKPSALLLPLHHFKRHLKARLRIPICGLNAACLFAMQDKTTPGPTNITICDSNATDKST